MLSDSWSSCADHLGERERERGVVVGALCWFLFHEKQGNSRAGASCEVGVRWGNICIVWFSYLICRDISVIATRFALLGQ